MDLAHPLAVVTPTVDGDVLAVLALADASFTTGQIHRLLGRFSEDGVRRALRRLTGQGIVLKTSAGNSHLYRLNRDHLAAEPVMELATIPQRLRQRIEDVLQHWDPAPVYGAVFGSAARRLMRGDSDIDVFLVRPNDADRHVWDEQVSRLVADVSLWTGNDVRVLEYDEAEVRHLGPDEPVLISIAADGLTVAGRRAWLSALLRRKERDGAAQ